MGIKTRQHSIDWLDRQPCIIYFEVYDPVFSDRFWTATCDTNHVLVYQQQWCWREQDMPHAVGGENAAERVSLPPWEQLRVYRFDDTNKTGTPPFETDEAGQSKWPLYIAGMRQ